MSSQAVVRPHLASARRSKAVRMTLLRRVLVLESAAVMVFYVMTRVMARLESWADAQTFMLLGLLVVVAGALPLVEVALGRFDPLEVRNLVVGALLAYGLMFVYIVAVEPAYQDASRVSAFLFAMSVAVAAFQVGYHLPLVRSIARRLPRPKNLSSTELRRAGTILTVFGGLLAALLIQSAGGLSSYLSLSYASTETLAFSEGKGHLAIGFSFLVGAAVLFIAAGTGPDRKRLTNVIGYAILLGLAFLHFKLGRRYEILALGILFLGTRHYLSGKLKARTIIAFFVAFYLFAALYGYYRGDLGRGVGGLVSQATKTFQVDLLSADRIGEFRDVPEALWELQGADLEPMRGSTYVRGIGQWVPHVLWSDRPEPLDKLRLEIFHPDVSQAGGSKAFFIVAEGYWNFGLWGIAVQMVLFGAFSGLLFAYHSMRLGDRRFTAVVYLLGLPIVVRGIRNDLMLTAKGVLLEFTLPLLLAVLVALGVTYVMSNRRVRST